jgi:uncharacterized protein involved in outer membrane biogenesis
LRRAVWVLLGVLLLWLLGWLALPPLLRSQGEKWAGAALGRTVHIGRVEFAPWALQLTLHDVAVAKAQGEGAQLTVQRLYVDVDASSLLRLAPVLDALEVDQPTLHLEQTAPGHYDVDDILARWAVDASPQPAPLPRFALYNVVLRDGAVDFVDHTVQRTHVLRALQLHLPFLSSLASKREIKVEPRLAFELNGSRFDSAAQSTPFLSSHHTQAQLHLADFDLAPYLAYVPASVPVQLQAGVLDLDLQLSFEQQEQARISVSGQLQARGLRLADRQQQPLLAVDAIRVQLADLQPLAQRGHLSAIEIEAPKAQAVRARDGLLNWQRLADGAPTAAASAPPPPSAPGWQWQIDQVRLHGGELDWRDEAVAGGAQLALQGLQLDAKAIAWPLQQPFDFAGRATLAGGQIGFQGQASARMATLATSIRELPLEAGAPYLGQYLHPRLDGRLDADLGLAWNDPAWVLRLAHLSLANVTLRCAPPVACPQAGAANKPHWLALAGLQLDDLRVNGQTQQVHLGRLALAQPEVQVERDARGRWMFESWLLPPPAAAPSPAGAATAARPWALQLGQIEVDGGTIALRDAQPQQAVALQLSQLRLRLQDLAPLAPGAAPARLELAARVDAGRRQAGQLQYKGSLGLAPLRSQGQLLATQLPLHALEPYVAQALNVRVLRADGSFKGSVDVAERPQGLQVHVQGDAAIDDLRLRSALLTRPGAVVADDDEAPRRLTAQDDLLKWKSLGLRGLDLALAPQQPLQLQVRETALSDFFARIIVQEGGRINLQDVLKQPSASGAAQSASAAPAATAATAAPIVRFGPITLAGGQVSFTDHFIKPNYSADLSELTGRLGAFSSQPPAPGEPPLMAELELRGRAEGTAQLEITGRLNPLAQPLALDIVGRMQGLELPPLSPYSIKYAGHGIERGKLSMEVSYQIQPDGQLTANNKLVLHQLSFGDAVEGAPASLPVRLATALLADSNGVIDLDLPISGSLNDPQFRVSAVIFKLLGNLIMKAVTAPFALLANALGGGGGDASSVAFAPGSAQLDGAAQASLDKVAKALQARPALTLTVVGQAQLASEREGWKGAQLQAMLLAQKRREARRSGADAEAVHSVSAAETPALLQALYRRADNIPKPRNLLGLPKELPPAEVQALLLASISLPDDAMHELATERGVAVRDYLAAHGVAPAQLFLGAVETAPQQDKWTPHAQLTLALP